LRNTTQSLVASRTFRLTKPRELQEITTEREVREGFVVIEPSLASICHADLRYYTGQRKPEVLARKLPMALLHEGIGTIVESRHPDRPEGQRVVVVPNLPGYLLRGIPPEQCCPACRNEIPDNYCSQGGFLGSGVDGIAQSRLVIPADCALPVPDSIPDEIAVLAELCSVSYRALSIVGDRLPGARVAVFGDGPVGYLTAAMLHHLFGLNSDRLIVFGAIKEKLDQFTFATREMVQEYDFNGGTHVDIAVDCTGGRFSESAVNQSIDMLNYGGHLILMGVSEERVPINTRDVLEKGITVYGSSRSSIADFQQVLKAMVDPSYQETLKSLVPEAYKEVSAADQLAAALESAAAHKDWKKTYLDFRW
jgi:ribitol-5-phosphate 2-dehydrogenase